MWRGFAVGAGAGAAALLSDTAIAPRITQSTWAKFAIDGAVAGAAGLLLAYLLHRRG